MFSYRHGFHAGNHADAFKHLVLVQLLERMRAKDKPFTFIDTHAGAGDYSLTGGFALKSREASTGIDRLWPLRTSGAEVPAAVAEYLEQVAACNDGATLARYPGSPRLAMQMLRPGDRARLIEAHPSEIDILREQFAAAKRRATVDHADGFAALKAMLPPTPRRALVLIDPSYEDKGDYKHVVTAMRDALQRFATGVYAIWYPQVQRRESHLLPEHLQRLAKHGDWLHVTLTVAEQRADGLGLHGSGVFVFNPPWPVEEAIEAAMPVLVDQLGQDHDARWQLDVKRD